MFGQVVIGLVVIYFLYYQLRKLIHLRMGYPPGPFPIPGIGNFHQVILADKHQPSIAFNILAKTYGNIFSLQLGVVNMIVVNGHEALKELLTKDDFAERTDEDWLLDRTNGKRIGLFLSDLEYSKPTRRFCVRTLGAFGFGKKKTMEVLINEEFEDLAQNIKSSWKNGILRMEHTFNLTTVNIISSLITGTRYSHNDSKLTKLLELMDEYMQSMQVGGILMAYPFLKNFAPDLCGFAAQQKANSSMQNYIKDLLKFYRQEGNYINNPSNFVEVFLQKIDYPDASEESGKSHSNILTDENLISIIYDLFHAGSDTTSHSLSFIVRYLIQHPRMQFRIQNEVDSVIGYNRRPSMADKSLMPFTEAFILEALRFSNVAPLTIRLARKTTTLGQYTILKGAQLLTNLYSANIDETVWENPMEFRPERFLSDKNEIINAEKLMTFSIGKRNCLGEAVAKSTIFLGLCCLVQNFEFGAVDGVPGNEIVPGITQAPVPFNVAVKNRFHF